MNMKRLSVTNRIVAFSLIFIMLYGLLPSKNVYAYTATVTYNNAVSSISEIDTRIDNLIEKYVGTYWTTNGKAADSSGSTSLSYYGIQCNGFAKLIFNDLFDCGSIGTYDTNKYYFPNTTVATLVEKKYNISETDSTTVKNILSKGKKGDFIQVRRRGKDYGHSMILVDADDSGLWIFDCNSDGKCSVKYYYQSYKTFASKNVGLSLYHANNYPLDSIPTITSAYGESHSEIKIKWNKVPSATKYEVKRRKAGTSDYITVTGSVTDTSYTDTGLNKNQRYFYKITAYNGSTPLGTSDGVGAYTKFDAPDVVSESNTKLTISWDSVSMAESYTIKRRRADEEEYKTIKTVNSSTRTYTDSNLDPATQYLYLIQANCNVDEIEMVSRSTIGTCYTMMNMPVVSLNDDSCITITWEKPKDFTEGKHKFRIYRKLDTDASFANKTLAEVTNGNTYIDTQTEPNTVYQYRIVMLDTSDNRYTYSSVGTGYSLMNAPAITLTDNSTLKISWEAPSDLDLSNHTYQIYRKLPDEESFKYHTLAYVTGQTYYEDSDIDPNQTYQYRIVLLDQKENRLTYSSIGTGYSLMNAPTITQTDSETLKISWNAPQGVNSSNHTYQIYRKLPEEESFKYHTLAYVTGQTHYEDSNIDPNQIYQYRIVLLDQEKNRLTYSDIGSGCVIKNTDASSVSNVTVKENTYLVTTSLQNIQNSCDIIVSGYQNKELVDITSVPYTEAGHSTTLYGTIDEIKVMVWDSLSTMSPLCEAEIITENNFITE
ncbi:MAG: hypothetical protein J6A61_06830 [Clostridia bacterium]|nr:hypothetical protein [Clostridia bacterium]